MVTDLGGNGDGSLILSKCLLFKGLDEASIKALIGCISPKEKEFSKEQYIFNEEDNFSFIGILLSGALHLIRDDYWGNRNILARFEAPDIFGEAFVCAGVRKVPVSLLAAENSKVLLFDFNKVITTCSSACAFHTMLIKNMLSNLAQKNLALMEKIEHITQHNTREKLLSFLYSIAKRQGRSTIEIPFNREELAAYLAVERSAMSAELCRMRDEGLIKFSRNKFTLPPQS